MAAAHASAHSARAPSTRASPLVRVAVLASAAAFAAATPHSTFPFEPMHGTPRVLADGSVEYEHEASHPLFGTHRVAYKASYMDGVIALHQNPHVTHVACTESTLTITLDDVSAAEFWTEGSLIASTSPLWLCPHAPVRIDNKDAPDGFEMHTPAPGPFSRIVLSRDSITMLSTGQVEDGEDFNFYAPSVLMAAGTPAAAAVITFTTKDVAAPSMFKSLDLTYVRHEAPVEGHLRELRETNASLAADMEALVHEARVLAVMPEGPQRARRLGWFSRAASRVSSRVSEAAAAAAEAASKAAAAAAEAASKAAAAAAAAASNVASNVASAASGLTVSGVVSAAANLSPTVIALKAVSAAVKTIDPNIGVWGVSRSFTVTFLDDNMSGRSLFSGDGSNIVCVTCYTRLTGSLEVNLKFDFATFTYMKVLGTVNVDMVYSAAGVFSKTVNFARQLPAVQSDSLWRTVTTIVVPVGPVPVPISLQARPSLAISGNVFGGFSLETPTLRVAQTISIGYESADGSLTPITSFSDSKSLSGGKFSVTGRAAQLKIGAGPQIRVVLFQAFFAMTVAVLPNLQVRAVTGTPPPAGSALFRASDRESLSRCVRGIVVSAAVGLDLSLNIQRPTFEMNVFGVKRAASLPVPGLPKDFTFKVIPGIAFDVKDVTGCRRASRVTVPGRLLQATTCAAGACKYVVGSWSTCPVECGLGKYSRSVSCALVADDSVLPLSACAAAPDLGPAPSTDGDCGKPCAFAVAGAANDGVFPNVVVTPLNPAGSRLGQQLTKNDNMLYAVTVPDGLYPVGGSPAIFISSEPRQGSIAFAQCDRASLVFAGDGTITDHAGCSPSVRATGVSLCSKVSWGLKRAACDVTRSQGVANGASLFFRVSALDVLSPRFLPAGTPQALLSTADMNTLRADAAITEFTVMPYVDLAGGDQMLPITVTLPIGVPSTMRHFRFRPSATAEGVFIDAVADPNSAGACDPSTVNVFASPSDGASWPRTDDMPFSTVRSPPRPSIANTRHRTLVIIDDSFQRVAYQITVTFTANCVFSLTATDIEPIYAGIAQQSSFDTNAVKMYRYKGQSTDSLFQAQVFTLSGDADLYVSRAQWRRRPSYTNTETDAQYSSTASAASGVLLDSVTVSNVDPRFGDEWYIAVTGNAGMTEYRIAVQSFEQTEQGIALSRLQLPLRYSQFLGSSIVAPRTRAAAVKGTNVTQDDAGLGFIARLGVPASSYSSFDLLAGSATRFFPAVYNGYQALAARNVLGNVMELGGSYVDRTEVARPFIFAVASGYAGVSVGDAQQVDAISGDRDLQASSSMATVLGPISNQNGGAAVLLPDLVSLAYVDAPVAAARDTQARAVSEVSSTIAVPAAARRRLASTAMAPDEDTSALLTLDPSAIAEFTPNTVILSPDAASGIWSPITTCAMNSQTFVTCLRVNVSTASASMRIRIPARTNINLRVTPTLVDGVTSDAAYTFVLNVGDVPLADPAAATAISSEEDVAVNTPFTAVSLDVPAPNCQYVALDAFATVTNNNRVSRGVIAPMAFDVMMQATPVGAFCPSYSWSTGSWSKCSATCANGTQARTVNCVSSVDNAVVSNDYCNPAVQPAATQACSVGACTWFARDWSDCSVVCGGGVQVRTVECRNGGGQGSLVSDRNCVPTAILPAQQTCNTDACTTVYWSTSPWTACSATCGGGYQYRTVTCADGATRAQLQRDICLGVPSIAGPEPASQQTCGTAQCAASPYNFIYFDKRSLVPGTVRVDSIPANTRQYYAYAPPVNSSGVCVSISTAPLSQDICGYAVQRKAYSCVTDFNGCMARAIQAAEQNSTAAGVFDPIAFWAVNDKRTVPPNSCACFTTVRACVAALPNCTSLAATAVSIMSNIAIGCDAFTPTPQPPTRSGANTGVTLYSMWNPAAYSVSGAQVAATFHPPSDLQPSLWTSMSRAQPLITSMMMSDWAPEDYAASTNELLIGAIAGASGADLSITVTPLTTYPATIQGTLTAATVSAAAIRAGGLTLTITLTCDQFVDPAVAVSLINPTSSATIASMRTTLGGRLTPNLIAAGMVSTTSPASGWNQIVRPFLLNATTPPFATISADLKTIALTLPPVPSYMPASDETLRLYVPFAVVASGRTLQFPSTYSVRIVTDSATCIVSPWSAWSACSAECNDGEQSRTRTIINKDMSRVNMASCPPLTDKQTCNTCDACAGTVCFNGGACYGGKCVCTPAWSGVRCDMPLAAGGSAYYQVGAWGDCNATCGGGVQSRSATCVLQQGLTLLPGNASVCAGLIVPSTTRVCNPQSCNSAAPVVGMNVVLSVPIERITSSVATYNAFETQMLTEIAGSLGVDAAAVTLVSVREVASSAGASKSVVVGIKVIYSSASRKLQAAAGAAVVDNARGALTSLAALSTSTRTAGTLLRTANWASTTVNVAAANGAEVAPAVSVTTVAASLPSSGSTSSSNSAYISGLIAGVVLFALLAGAAVVALVFVLRRTASNAANKPTGATDQRKHRGMSASEVAVGAAAPETAVTYSRTAAGIARFVEPIPASAAQPLDIPPTAVAGASGSV